MKRMFFVLYLLCLPLYSGAQSILGIPFGSSYQTTKECLESRFGSFKVREDGGKLIVLNPIIGDHEFKAADFFFQRQGQATWLSEVFIQTWFDASDVSTAKYLRDELANVLREKYNVNEYTNDTGFKCYGFGVNPKDDNKYLGTLGLMKSKGNDGKQRLYLTLSYGPIYYINKSSDF